MIEDNSHHVNQAERLTATRQQAESKLQALERTCVSTMKEAEGAEAQNRQASVDAAHTCFFRITCVHQTRQQLASIHMALKEQEDALSEMNQRRRVRSCLCVFGTQLKLTVAEDSTPGTTVAEKPAGPGTGSLEGV